MTWLILLLVVSLIIIGIMFENWVKPKCKDPNCNGFEWGRTGHCSECRKPITNDAEEFFRQVREERIQAKKEALARGSTKTCPDCMMVVPSGARRCAHCRYLFWA
jgi:hypothetical protein